MRPDMNSYVNDWLNKTPAVLMKKLIKQDKISYEIPYDPCKHPLRNSWYTTQNELTTPVD